MAPINTTESDGATPRETSVFTRRITLSDGVTSVAFETKEVYEEGFFYSHTSHISHTMMKNGACKACDSRRGTGVLSHECRSWQQVVEQAGFSFVVKLLAMDGL